MNIPDLFIFPTFNLAQSKEIKGINWMQKHNIYI